MIVARNVNSPATAPTVPGHGSTLPVQEKKMNKHLDNTKAAEKPVPLPSLLAAVAAGYATEPPVSHAEAAPQEEPWVKVRRLAGELSAALTSVEEGGWFAKVYPKDEARGWSVLYGEIQAEHDARLAIEAELSALIEDHKAARAAAFAARKAIDEAETIFARKPTRAEKRLCSKARRAEDAALSRVISYVPFNDVSRFVKVNYIARFTLISEITEAQIRTLLTSLCGRLA